VRSKALSYSLQPFA